MLRITIILLATLLGTAHAQIVDSPRGMAMSGVRADPVGSSAVMYNPAGLSRSYVYAVEGQYFRSGPGDKNGLALNIVDSKAQPQLAVGMSYGFQFTDDQAEVSEKGHDVRLAFAHPAIPERLHLGVGLRYLTIERDMEGQEVDNLEGFTLDAGVLISLSRVFHIGFVGHNLVDIKDPSLPRRAGGGVSYTGAPLGIDVDVLMDFESHEDGPKPVVSSGFELLLGGSVPIRGGYIYDAALETSWVSWGLGFMTGQAGTGGQLSLSFRQNLDDAEEFGFGLGLSLFI